MTSPLTGNKEPSDHDIPIGNIEIDFDSMEPFPGHKFKLYEGQRLDDMAESIRKFSILLPIILWHTDDDRYIILSGHNRVNAGRLAGLTKGPATIRDNLTHEEAVLIVNETNPRQRSFADLSHSERAYRLAQHYGAQHWHACIQLSVGRLRHADVCQRKPWLDRPVFPGGWYN